MKSHASSEEAHSAQQSVSAVASAVMSIYSYCFRKFTPGTQVAVPIREARSHQDSPTHLRSTPVYRRRSLISVVRAFPQRRSAAASLPDTVGYRTMSLPSLLSSPVAIFRWNAHRWQTWPNRGKLQLISQQQSLSVGRTPLHVCPVGNWVLFRCGSITYHLQMKTKKQACARGWRQRTSNIDGVVGL